MKETVNQLGYDSYGNNRTPLMSAAMYQHTNIVEYLLQQHDADVSITNDDGYNALHIAAYRNTTNTNLIQLLLNKMSLNDINHKTNNWKDTPLDKCYRHNNTSIQQDIITLIRKHGGKANYRDKNGNRVGRGNGDLNDKPQPINNNNNNNNNTKKQNEAEEVEARRRAKQQKEKEEKESQKTFELQNKLKKKKKNKLKKKKQKEKLKTK